MSPTPFPRGEPPSAAAHPVDNELSSGREVSARPRLPSSWRQVSWVGFANDDEPDRSALPPASALTNSAAMPPASEGTHDAPMLEISTRETGRLEADVACLDLPGSRAALSPRPLAERRTRFRRAAPSVAKLRRRAQHLGWRLRHLLRIAAVATTTGAVAVFAYQGGERLAGFATGPEPQAAVHATQALTSQALATEVPATEPKPARVTEAHSAPAPAIPDGATPALKTAALATDTGPVPEPVRIPDRDETNASAGASERAAFYLDRANAGDPSAQYNLGVLYTRGEGVAANPARAAQWFRVAATSGNATAQYNLAVSYEHGVGVAQDVREALTWYRRAAQQNYAPAQYNLAVACEEGRGMPADRVAAMQWYRQAAAQGLLPAMVNLAILYETGIRERSLPDAYAWYRAAARAGDAEAERRARELLHQLAGADKAKAVTAAAAVAETVGRHAAPARAGERSARGPRPGTDQPAG